MTLGKELGRLLAATSVLMGRVDPAPRSRWIGASSDKPRQLRQEELSMESEFSFSRCCSALAAAIMLEILVPILALAASTTAEEPTSSSAK